METPLAAIRLMVLASARVTTVFGNISSTPLIHCVIVTISRELTPWWLKSVDADKRLLRRDSQKWR
ncbi:hypothetical protein FHT77_004185 [Rhizobium sp. BK181]|uniref:hypothetical protein n=1 Tax=Rhizobium sp. BK181 TaxID=2587072 RepID=UPI0016157E34|nr:hypothetical protein [Rhizobium sp. BK181]MBB3318289.1 hypothetical protein [Rhizobium sp. BK181]